MPTGHDAARARLVAALVRDGRVHTPRIRAALDEVPRHLFLPGLDPDAAYADEAVGIKTVDGVTVSSVSQPSMVAIMLEQLEPAPGHRVLEVGAGAGWNAGLLAHVVGPDGAVTTVDIDEDLVAGSRTHLAEAGSAAEAITADGSLGYPPRAPYDRIELTVGSAGVRPEWVTQLAPGGRLLLPLTVRGSQLSVAFAHTGLGLLASTSVRSCAFVRLRGAGAEADGGAAPVLAGEDWSVQPACASSLPEFEALRMALNQDGTDRPATVAGTASDLWDGLGLWCAVADPAVVRVLGPYGSRLADALFPLAGARAGLGLVTEDGCALLLADPPATIRAFGRGGVGAADRLAALTEGWHAAGRPHAADLQIEAIVPDLLAVPPRPLPDNATEIVDEAGTRLRLVWGAGTG